MFVSPRDGTQLKILEVHFRRCGLTGIAAAFCLVENGLLSVYNLTKVRSHLAKTIAKRYCKYTSTVKSSFTFILFFLVRFCVYVCPGWSSSYDACLDSERLGFNSPLDIGFIWIASCHLFNLLLHLVASVISELKMHEDMLSLWRGECDSDQVSWWSSGYDTCLDSMKPGFNPLLRHCILSEC